MEFKDITDINRNTLIKLATEGYISKSVYSPKRGNGK